ncbi:hypothetical protein [Thalassobius sp. I31.1]|uniref:hypothetical protein n=1 Tax=Thalassobius sp. I31.1 TaxID=2109912 RepID=UPI000D1A5EED|nr:hypothetical protein [Thalassobius sp. I31.1]
MNHQNYVRWLREAEHLSKDYHVTSRSYPNPHGANELIFLPQNYWHYVDWLEVNTDITFADWVIHCAQNPHEATPISHLLMYWLWQDECSRWINCLPAGSDRLPKGFRFWKASYGTRVWTAGFGGWNGHARSQAEEDE